MCFLQEIIATSCHIILSNYKSFCKCNSNLFGYCCLWNFHCQRCSCFVVGNFCRDFFAVSNYFAACFFYTHKYNFPASAFRNNRHITQCFSDHKCIFFSAGKCQLSSCPVFFFIHRCISLVLPQSEASVLCREYTYLHRLRVVCAAVIVSHIFHRNDGSGFHQNRQIFYASPQIQHTSALIYHTGKEVSPHTFRQPCMSFGRTCFRILLFCNRRYQKFRTEIIFVWYLISLVTLRLQIIHRLDQRKILIICSPVHSIQIWNHAMTQTQVFFHHALCDLIKFPWFLSIKRIIRAMQTVNRREYSILYPSCH